MHGSTRRRSPSGRAQSKSGSQKTARRSSGSHQASSKATGTPELKPATERPRFYGNGPVQYKALVKGKTRRVSRTAKASSASPTASPALNRPTGTVRRGTARMRGRRNESLPPVVWGAIPMALLVVFGLMMLITSEDPQPPAAEPESVAPAATAHPDPTPDAAAPGPKVSDVQDDEAAEGAEASAAPDSRQPLDAAVGGGGDESEEDEKARLEALERMHEAEQGILDDSFSDGAGPASSEPAEDAEDAAADEE